MDGTSRRLITGDHSRTDKTGERLVERNATGSPLKSHLTVNLVGQPFPDQVPDRVRHAQHFDGGNATPSDPLGNQVLNDDGGEAEGELRANLRLPFFWKDVDDPVDRLRHRSGMEGREDEVA